MNHHFQILQHQLLSPGATINQSRQTDSQAVTLDDNAIAVLTDFKHTRPFSITSSATINETNNTMIVGGVRLLFVADSDGVLQGLITYTDLFGEKSVQYIKEHGGTREEILAQDIMTPLLQLEALQYDDITSARVGDIVETIKTAGRQHMLVTTLLEDDTQVITGIFSSTHIEKRLGIKIELSARANTFADLERALT
jgi:CBS domain containing-hemolysin-like protein